MVHDEDLWDLAFTPTRREHRHEQKMARYHDRSQYKISNKQKNVPTPSLEGLYRGRVLYVCSHDIEVQLDDGTLLTCSLKGALKQYNRREKNLVVAGDIVYIDRHDAIGRICHIAPRDKNVCRQDHLRKIKKQIVASHVDNVCITIALHDPLFKLSMVDRYIVAARKEGMTPIVIINKIDLKHQYPENYAQAIEACDAYRQYGIVACCVSAQTGEGLDTIRHHMTGVTSVFAGQSGTGKTCLVNAITGLSLRTMEVRAAGKGSHTTTMARLCPLSFGGWCVDTPGIRSFGVWELTQEDVVAAFPDIHAIASGCSFIGCLHRDTDSCAVIDAVADGRISKQRYQSYCSLIDSI